MADGNIYDTIVVGCGAAGIASLTRMHHAGLKVLGLEAACRIGGRVNTISFADSIIEMGAEWVHGEEGNIVHSIALKYDIFEPTNFEFEFYHSNGTLLDRKLGSDLLYLCMNITNSVGDFVTSELQSMADHFSKIYPETLKNDGLVITPELEKSFSEWYHKQENVIDGCDDWSDISTKGLAQYKVCEGNSVISWGKNGYKTIFDILLKSYPDPQNKLNIPIFTNKIVKNIIWKNATSDNVEIICEDGSSYFCKSSIVTVSLGVLKEKHMDLFHPQLPKDKISCIEGISIGTVNKIFLLYENNWWGKPRWFGLLWSEEEKAKIAKADEWLLSLFCISCPNSNPNILCAWISGKASRHMETLPHDLVKKKVENVLKSFFGKLFEIPVADEMIRSSWYSNPLTRGSYSYHSMECDEHNASTEGLQTPLLNDIGQPIIAFAGEATSKQYFSTVHGAVESGFREADRILEYLKPSRLKLGTKL